MARKLRKFACNEDTSVKVVISVADYGRNLIGSCHSALPGVVYPLSLLKLASSFMINLLFEH